MIFFLLTTDLPRGIIAIKPNVQKRNQSTEINHVLDHDLSLHLGLDQNDTAEVTVMITNGSKEDHRPGNTVIKREIRTNFIFVHKTRNKLI